MKQIVLYDNLMMKMPEELCECEEEERKMFFGFSGVDHAYSSNENVYLAIKKSDKTLKKEDVKNRIMEYHKVYQRIIPGFELGELKLKKSDEMNIGIMTYKSNAIDKDLFNLLCVGNYGEEELIIVITTDINKAFKQIPVFVNMVNSLGYVDVEDGDENH